MMITTVNCDFSFITNAIGYINDAIEALPDEFDIKIDFQKLEYPQEYYIANNRIEINDDFTLLLQSHDVYAASHILLNRVINSVSEYLNPYFVDEEGFVLRNFKREFINIFFEKKDNAYIPTYLLKYFLLQDDLLDVEDKDRKLININFQFGGGQTVSKLTYEHDSSPTNYIEARLVKLPIESDNTFPIINSLKDTENDYNMFKSKIENYYKKIAPEYEFDRSAMCFKFADLCESYKLIMSIYNENNKSNSINNEKNLNKRYENSVRKFINNANRTEKEDSRLYSLEEAIIILSLLFFEELRKNGDPKFENKYYNSLNKNSTYDKITFDYEITKKYHHNNDFDQSFNEFKNNLNAFIDDYFVIGHHKNGGNPINIKVYQISDSKVRVGVTRWNGIMDFKNYTKYILHNFYNIFNYLEFNNMHARLEEIILYANDLCIQASYDNRIADLSLFNNKIDELKDLLKEKKEEKVEKVEKETLNTYYCNFEENIDELLKLSPGSKTFSTLNYYHLSLKRSYPRLIRK
ncbi:hypothetical protein [Staphylococcus delphini]|uniref:hypothetical protein n=1 Tax=Staphylococcus delphini TaxID=53344 RepID=UPI001BB07AC4|nr:hypothetical protein [Staphylococcus delphini]QUM67025.1 hypothetical protein IPU21_00445 [Staphylococcus delphini]